jgi:hypothetical protein
VHCFHALAAFPPSNSKRQDGNSNSLNRYASRDFLRRLAGKIFLDSENYGKEQEVFVHKASIRNHLFMPSAAEHRYASHRLLNAVNAAAILGNCNACIGDLSRARLSTQLRNEFANLAQPRRADRMSFRLKAARWIDRDAAADPGLSARRDRAAVAEGTEAQIFYLDDFTHGRGIVHFGD